MIDFGTTKVSCITCEKNVDTLQARSLTLSGKQKYECFNCYRQNKNSPSSSSQERNTKLDLFCARCKYKFHSRDLLCPYCSQSDLVTRADLSVKDFL